MPKLLRFYLFLRLTEYNSMATIRSSASYTQEARFEQAITGAIADLWQQRQEGFTKTKDKTQLYWCKLTAPHHRKAVVLVNGRIEASIKYQELMFDLFRQGFDVYSYDHRGQGWSQRLVEGSDIGHIHEFSDYVADLEHMLTLFDLTQYDKRFLVAHSMGGAIATRYLQTHPKATIDGVVLSSPMLGIDLAWYLNPIAISLSQILTAVYPRPTYAPGHKAYYPKPFEDNPLSQSLERYQWFRHLYAEQPQLQVGGPSTRWVWQSLMAAKQCLLHTRQITTPLLLIQAGDDTIVSNRAQNQFIRKLGKTNPQAEFISIPDARHEILFERDQYRNPALDALFGFLNK